MKRICIVLSVSTPAIAMRDRQDAPFISSASSPPPPSFLQQPDGPSPSAADTPPAAPSARPERESAVASAAAPPTASAVASAAASPAASPAGIDDSQAEQILSLLQRLPPLQNIENPGRPLANTLPANTMREIVVQTPAGKTVQHVLLNALVPLSVASDASLATESGTSATSEQERLAVLASAVDVSVLQREAFMAHFVKDRQRRLRRERAELQALDLHLERAWGEGGAVRGAGVDGGEGEGEAGVEGAEGEGMEGEELLDVRAAGGEDVGSRNRGSEQRQGKRRRKQMI